MSVKIIFFTLFRLLLTVSFFLHFLQKTEFFQQSRSDTCSNSVSKQFTALKTLCSLFKELNSERRSRYWIWMLWINIFWLSAVVFCVIKMLLNWVNSDNLFQNSSLWLTECIESFEMNINNEKIMKMLQKMSLNSEFSSENKLKNYSWIKSWIIILKQFKTISTDLKLHIWLSDSLFKNKWLFYYKNYWLSLQAAKKNQYSEDLKSVLQTIHAVKMKSEHQYIRENLNIS